jgi:hypothetical protein
MVMRHLCTILAVLITAIGLEAAPVVLDFSRSHTMEDVRRSGLKVTELGGLTYSKFYHFESQEVSVVLPGRREFHLFVKDGFFTVSNGALRDFDLCGGVVPQDQVRLVAASFCQSFDLSKLKLEEWYARNAGTIHSSDTIGFSPNLAYYPLVTLRASDSMNPRYPWTLAFHIVWNDERQRDWSEERVWAELALPSHKVISLNPPSGLKYNRADAYVWTNFLILCLLVGVGLSLLLVPWLLWRKYRGKS